MSTPVEASESPAGPGASYNFPPATSRTVQPPLDPHQHDLTPLPPPRLPSPTAAELPAGSSDDGTFIENTTPRNHSFAVGDEHLHHEPYQNRLRRHSEVTSASRARSPNRALEYKEEDDYELMKVERQVSNAVSHSQDPYHREVHALAHDPSVPVGDSGEPEGHGHGPHHGPWRPRVHETNKFARFVKKVS